jgi:predicted branched-subunit amino acid permease
VNPQASTPGSTEPPSVSFTLGGVKRGYLRAQGLAIGILAYGLAFGLLAEQARLSAVQAMLMSGFVYSGSAQLAAVGVLSAGAASLVALASALAATIFVINARYILFSATLRPWLAPLPGWQAYGTLFFIGDGSWLISMRAYEDGERDAGFLFGANISTFLPWVVGTWLGSIAVGFAPDPRKLGSDFFLVAFAASMMIGMINGGKQKGWGLVAVVAAAAGAGILAAQFTGFGGGIVAAGLAGGAVAFFTYREEARA